MKTIHVWQRELVSLFTSPVGYITIAAMVVINSYFFWIILNRFQIALLSPLLNNMSITLLFLAPAFTMRQLAEEKKSGTIELLYTAPLTDTQIVLGKYLAALTLLLAYLVISFMYPAFLDLYGEPDYGPIVTGYLGIFLMGASYLVVGLFVSSLTSNQVIAFIGSLGILMLLFFLNAVADNPSLPAWGQWILNNFALTPHFEEFLKGLISLKDVVYYVVFITFFLFITVRSVESRKWR